MKINMTTNKTMNKDYIYGYSKNKIFNVKFIFYQFIIS